MKRLLVSISYNYFVLPAEADISAAIATIGHLMPVEQQRHDGKTIYSPDKDISISFDLINEKAIRPPTPEEAENKKIKDLESSLSYNKGLVDQKDKRIKELQCVVDQLTKEGKADEDNKQEVPE